MNPPIYVTKPDLPPLEELGVLLERVWASGQVTNGGPLHRELEVALAEYLRVPFVSLFNNATIALLVALRAQRVTGEVITTPYSFVATAHSILWNGLTPVFVDVDPVTLNLDPARVEAAITPNTTAILPVHCYGQPCDVDAIQAIADDHGLRVIYDAAHAFGVEDAAGSVLNHGDLSVVSFHATKVFNTLEGGAIASHDEKTKRYVDRLKNFGFVDEVTVVATGINGKMNELQAAIGLLNLRRIDAALQRRREIAASYRRALGGVSGLTLPAAEAPRVANGAYFPVFVEPDAAITRDQLQVALRQRGIHARRYFYPLITAFPMYRNLPSAKEEGLPVAASAARRVLCLPIYPSMTDEDVQGVVSAILEVM